jgi:hypothetical protein
VNVVNVVNDVSEKIAARSCFCDIYAHGLCGLT